MYISFYWRLFSAVAANLRRRRAPTSEFRGALTRRAYARFSWCRASRTMRSEARSRRSGTCTVPATIQLWSFNTAFCAPTRVKCANKDAGCGKSLVPYTPFSINLISSFIAQSDFSIAIETTTTGIGANGNQWFCSRSSVLKSLGTICTKSCSKFSQGWCHCHNTATRDTRSFISG